MPGSCARALLARAPTLALLEPSRQLPGAVHLVRGALPGASDAQLVAFAAHVPWALREPSLLRQKLRALESALPPGVRAWRIALYAPRVLNLRSVPARLRRLCELLPEAEPAHIAEQIPTLLTSDIERTLAPRIAAARAALHAEEWAALMASKRLGRTLLSSNAAFDRLRMVRAALPHRPPGARPRADALVTMPQARFDRWLRSLEPSEFRRALAAGATASPPKRRGAESEAGRAARGASVAPRALRTVARRGRRARRADGEAEGESD